MRIDPRVALATLAIAVALTRPAQGQFGFHVVADDWSPTALNEDYGQNYGLGLREAAGESYVRGFWSFELMLKHRGGGTLYVIPLSAGVTVGPKGGAVRPYALAAAGCFGKFQAGIECSPVIGAGVELPVLGRTYLEFWNYTRIHIRRALTVGVYLSH